jgi:hypothetical protein
MAIAYLTIPAHYNQGEYTPEFHELSLLHVSVGNNVLQIRDAREWTGFPFYPFASIFLRFTCQIVI